MSKKSRRRNKRLLALAGLAGAVALSRRKNATADVDSGRGGDSSSAEARANANKKTDYITKKDTSKSDVVAAPKKVNNNTFRTRGRITDSAGNTIPSETKMNYVKNAKINALNTAEGSPSIDNPYKSKPNPRGRGNFMKSGGRAGLKSGGKVRGCGIAKRGLGRAMKKGKR